MMKWGVGYFQNISLFMVGMIFMSSSASIAAEQDFSNVEITKTHVAGRVHLLTGQGGNMAAHVGNDGILLVDDQFAPLAEKIKMTLDSFSSGEVKFVLNTHWHYDHTGANAFFGRNATLIAHENVRKRLSVDQVIEIFNKTVAAQPKVGLPVITLSDSLSIHFNDEQIEVIHFPAGHTDGDTVIFFKDSNVVHLGDHFFNGGFPFVDVGSGGSVDGYIANVQTILGMLDDDTKIIPGHGSLASKTELGAFHQMMVETVRIIRAQSEAGASIDSIKTLLAPWAEWGKGFISTDKWVEIVLSEKS